MTAMRYHDDEHMAYGLEEPWAWWDDTAVDDNDPKPLTGLGWAVCVASAAGVAVTTGIIGGYIFNKILNVVCAVDPSFSYCIPG